MKFSEIISANTNIIKSYVGTHIQVNESIIDRSFLLTTQQIDAEILPDHLR